MACFAASRCVDSDVGFAHPSKHARTPSHKESAPAATDRKPNKAIRFHVTRVLRRHGFPMRSMSLPAQRRDHFGSCTTLSFQTTSSDGSSSIISLVTNHQIYFQSRSLSPLFAAIPFLKFARNPAATLTLPPASANRSA
jgi:hypothetical protein